MSEADDLLALAPDLLADPEIRAHLRERVLELIDATFDQALEGLEVGSVQTQTAILKTTLPMLLRVAKDGEEVDTEDMEEMKAETRRMILEAGEELPGQVDA